MMSKLYFINGAVEFSEIINLVIGLAMQIKYVYAYMHACSRRYVV